MREVTVVTDIRRVGLLRRRYRATTTMPYEGGDLTFSVEGRRPSVVLAETKRIVGLLLAVLPDRGHGESAS